MPQPGPELAAHERIDDRVDAVLRNDPAPEQMTEVRAQRIDTPLRPVERQRVVAAAVRHPECLVEARGEHRRFLLQTTCEHLVAPCDAGQLGKPPLRVVDVALHLGGGDRRLGKAAVTKPLGIAESPSTTDSRARWSGARTRQSRRRPGRRGRRSSRARPAPAREAGERDRRRPSSATPRTAARCRAASRRRSRSSAQTTSRPHGRGAAHAGSCPALRRSTGRRPATAARRERRAR